MPTSGKHNLYTLINFDIIINNLNSPIKNLNEAILSMIYNPNFVQQCDVIVNTR